MKDIMNMIFLGNSVAAYSIASAILLLSFLIINIVIRYIIRHLKRIALNTATTIDDFIVSALERLFIPFLFLLSAYIAIKCLTLSPGFENALNYCALAVTIFFAARFIKMLAVYSFKLYLSKGAADPALERSLHGILIVIKVLVWGGVAMFFLDNMGFKISAILAGLGIGGVAVALAAQAILKDLFSYFSIIFDRPFKIGDFIIVGNDMGTIEYIGIKTTRIRSLGGEMIIISNSDLTDARVHNYKLMDKRRIVFKVGVTYETPTDKLKMIPSVVESSIKNIKDAIFDRAHFLSYGDSSLMFEIVYYVVGADYNKYMDIQQEINLAIKEKFEKIGVEFAYPTQTIYLNKT